MLPHHLLSPLQNLKPCCVPWAKVGFLRHRHLFCTLRQRISGAGKMAPPLEVKDRIILTEEEEKIFGRLLDVVRHFNLDTQLRVAGGWVRDKLLGKDCYDIDIALDNMMGQQFCEKVNEFLQYAGEKQQGIGVIQSNPDQSKHLETATMHIYGMSIDFVNLRSETYTENSRIPLMKFGTAEVDAYRRDLTINSLFYNINSRSVEDLTGRGIDDLKAGIIVTPLPPKNTFLDDPLRILRAIRFGSRFNFVLDEELKRAAADAEVKAAIADKISRERIGHEIDLMMSDNQPVKAMRDISDLTLFWSVFMLPENIQPTLSEVSDRLCISYLDATWDALQWIGSSVFTDEQQRLCFYGALFLPFRNMVYQKKSQKIPVTQYLFLNSLKLKADDAKTVSSLHAAAERFVSYIPFLLSSGNAETFETEIGDEFLGLPPVSKQRILAGSLLHQIKDFWRVSLLLSTLLYFKEDCTVTSRGEIFRKVESAIVELDLDYVWEGRPLVRGDAIMDVLHLRKGGPVVREWQQKLGKWQLAHPKGSAEDCLDWMKQLQAKRPKMEGPT